MLVPFRPPLWSTWPELEIRSTRIIGRPWRARRAQPRSCRRPGPLKVFRFGRPKDDCAGKLMLFVNNRGKKKTTEERTFTVNHLLAPQSVTCPAKPGRAGNGSWIRLFEQYKRTLAENKDREVQDGSKQFRRTKPFLDIHSSHSTGSKPSVK